MLLGDQLVDALADALERQPAGEDAPYLSYMDGALAGLLLAARPIPEEEWLPRLGAGTDAGFADPADRAHFAGLLGDRKAEIAVELLRGGLAFAPYYDFDERGEPAWQIWLLGFTGAVALDRGNWEALTTSDDEDVGAAMMGLMALTATLPGIAGALPQDEDLSDFAELSEQAPELIPYFVETLYRRQRGLPRIVLTDAPPDEFIAPALKVGRNEPCPCGSGKKFKKCCGG